MNSKQTDKGKISNNNYRCVDFLDKKICVNSMSISPFKESHEYYTMLSESIDNVHLKVDKNCVVQSVDCFSTNLKNVTKFIGIFLLATIFTNLLHELFHFLILSFAGENVTGLSFDVVGGVTYLESWDINNHSMWVWFFAIMGPLLFVNTFFVLFSIVFYDYEGKLDRPYREFATIKEEKNEVFVKSIGYVSSLLILTNTLFSPITSFVYNKMGTNSVTDLQVAWKVSFAMDNTIHFLGGTFVEGAIFRVIILVVAGLESSLALYYIFVYGRKNI
mgnify:CR=1 FL=1